MTFPLKNAALASGKRNRSKAEEEMGSKRHKYDIMTALGETGILNRQRIYNSGIRKKPAELFRKDLISAMKLPDSDQLNQEDYLLITDTWKEEWEKGVQVPVNPDSLPDGSHVRPVAPAFRDVQKSSESSQSPGSPFKMPKKMLSFEQDRDAIASKYELDLTDHFWLQSVRDSEEQIQIEEDMFEEVMNELEYQCARNMKAKHVGIEFDDHIVCDICRSPDAEDQNEMVFCDLCNICVHQACYGIVEIPDGEWLCRPCKQFGAQASKKVSCLFCPNSGGAFKSTSTNDWAHLSCALWIPEVSIGCVSTMEPITKIKSIPSSRWNLICSFCNEKQGAPIQCSVKTCKVAYHVTCAFNHHLKLKAIVKGDGKEVKLESYCSKHMDLKDSDSAANSSESETSSEKVPQEFLITTSSNLESDKNNRFWMYIDISEINQMLIPKFTQQFPSLSSSTIILYMDIILQYWKMKRTSNYGLPLIKVVTQDTIEEIQAAHRNDILRLRVHLERIRNLSYMITRREKIKRSWLMYHQQIVQLALTLCTDVQKKATNGSGRSLFPNNAHGVPDELLDLARNVVSSNVIYNEETEAEKVRSKRAIKELNRLAKIDQLRKRSPNPYERKYMNGQLKRRDGRPEDEEEDVFPIRKIPLKTTPTKVNSSKVNGSSLLIRSPKKTPLSPAKTSPSSTENLNSLLLKSPIKSHISKNRDPQSLLQPVTTRSSDVNKKKRHNAGSSPKKVPNPAATAAAVIRMSDEEECTNDAHDRQACCLN